MTALSALPPPVHSYISDFVARARRLAIARAVGLAAAIFVGWTLVCCALDRFAQFNGWTRLALLASGLMACAVLVLRPLEVARRRTNNVLLAAAEIERHDPRFGQRLITVVSRLKGPPEHRGSEDILYRLLKDVSRQAGSARRSRPIPLRRVIRPWLALVALVALGAYLARQPNFGLPRLLMRYAAPLAAVDPVTTTRLVVVPGDTDVEQSRPLRIEVTAHRLGEGRTVWVWLSEDGGDWVRRPMNCASGTALGESANTSGSAGAPTRFTFTLSSIERDLRYYVEGGDAETREYVVRSLRRPAVAEFRIRYVYSPYADRPPLTVTNADGLIEAPAGTGATVTVVATEPLQSAVLKVGEEQILMARTTEANVRRATFKVARSGPYTIDMISTRDIPGGGPAGMFVRALSDQRPLARLLQAGENLRLNPRDILPLSYQVLDDFGLGALSVRVQVNGGPPVDVPVPLSGDPRRQEGTFNFDLATIRLGIGDVVTVNLAARDRAGQQATSEPLQVLLAPRSVDLETHQRVSELESAAQLATLVVGELEATARALEEAKKEHGKNADAESAAVGRANRLLTTAIDTAVLMRQSVLRSVVRSSSAELSTALANVVDWNQVLTAGAEVLFRSNDMMVGGGAGGVDPAHERLKTLLERGRQAREQLSVIADGERAAAVLADRENLATSEKRAAAADAQAAERIRQTLRRAKEEVDAGAKGMGLDPAAPNLDDQLRAKVEAAQLLLRSQRPTDFAAAAREWSTELQKDPLRRMILDERLAAAAQAEAVRPGSDLSRARDLQLCARAAARLASDAAADKYAGRPVSPERPDNFANAVAALQEEHEIDRRPANVRKPDEVTAVRRAAAEARALVTQWAGDGAALATAGADATGPAAGGAAGDLRARLRRAEDLAIRAGAETAARDYEAARASDRELARGLAASSAAESTAPAAQAPTPVAAGPPLPASMMRDLRRVERLTDDAERIDHIQSDQDRLADETRDANADRAAALAGRQSEVAQRIAEVGQAEPAPPPPPAPSSVSAGAGRPAEGSADEENWRGRATAALLRAQEQLAAMPQELTRTQEAAATLRQAAARAAMARAEAAAAPPERKVALERALEQAELERAHAEERLRATASPVGRDAADALAMALAPFEPESTVAREIVSRQLAPSLQAFEQAGDVAASERAAVDARASIDAAQKELARAQQLFTERDPLIAAKWFARAAADSLARTPPDLNLAQGRQRDTSAALSRAWDRTIHQAAAQRLALLPSMQSLYGVPVPPPVLPSGAAGGAAAPSLLPPVPDLASVREWGRLRPRELEELNGPLRESEPPGYEKALQLYFQRVGQAQGKE